jgi:hypothetical protein
MPDGNIQPHLTSRLTATLTAGAPLRAPLVSQARYARPAASSSSTNPIWRTASLGGAALAALMLVALAGPQEPRGWLLQSIGSVALNDGAQVGQSMPSPKPASGWAATVLYPRQDAGKADRQPPETPGRSHEPIERADRGDSSPGDPAHGGKSGHGSGGSNGNQGQGNSNSHHKP